jgi:competence protein ComEC
MRVDLRLAVPAAVAWLAAGVSVGLPAASVQMAVACWAVAGLLVAVAVARSRGWIALVAVCAITAALACTSAALHAPARQPVALAEAASSGRFVRLELAVSEAVGESGGTGEASARVPPYAAVITRFALGSEGEAVRGGASVPALVFDGRPHEAVGIGTSLAVSGTLVAADPGDDVGFLVFASGDPRVLGPAPPTLAWANSLRSSFSHAAAALPGQGGELLPGLAIGDTSRVGEDLDAAMKASSLSHLTAVSGANCAIVIALVVFGGAALGLSRGVRIAASITVLAGFVVLVTPQSSVVRAAVMAVIVLIAVAGGRPVRGVPVLSLACLVLLVGDPWLSRDYGFALSVLATGGLLVLAGPLTRMLARVLPLPLAAVVAIPSAAQLACQPVLLMLDPTIAAFGVVANLLAEPAAPLATVIGLLACVALPVLPEVGHLLAAAAWLPASWIAAVATFFAGLPGGALPWPGGIPGVLLLAAVTVLSLVAALGGVSRRARLASAALAAVVLVGLVGALTGVRVLQRLDRPADWQIAACDIGQGDAVLVRSAGRVALVDTGPDPEPLTRCLDDLGIGRIDLLVLSHYDLDHVGGTAAVIGRVDRALVGPSADAEDDRLLAALVAGGAVVERASRGLTGTLGELRFSVLWPRARLGTVEPGNDASITVAFDGVGRCAAGCLGSMFLGDLGERAQALVLAAGTLPRVDVVKVAHHGSADQSPRLYERLAATVGVISVGAGNDYGHPTDRLLDELAAVGTVAERTDLAGLVLLSPGPDGTVSVWTEKDPGP